MKKRILLLNPSFQNKIKAVAQQSVGQPLGILSIASKLKKNGFTVNVLDLNSFFISDNELLAIIKKYCPSVIGLSASTPSILECSRLCELIKKHNKNIITIVGGPHPTLLPKETLENYKYIDNIAIGEVENYVCEFFNKILNNEKPYNIKGFGFKDKDNKIILNERVSNIENLSEQPWPSRELVNNFNYRNPDSFKFSTMIAMRGCPAKCIYCSVPEYFGKKIRHREPIDVVNEMESVYIRYGIDNIGFVDDTFTYDLKWVKKFCNILIKKKLPIKWCVLARVDTVNYSILKLMKKAGLYKIEFGIESGSEKILKFLKKNVTLAQIKKAFKMAKKLDLLTMTFFILNIPGENIEDLKKSKDLLMEIDPDFVQISFATPYPKTYLNKYAHKKNIIKHFNYSDYRFLNEIILKNKYISEENLRKFHQKMLMNFHFRFSYIYRILKYIFQGKLNLSTVFYTGVYSVKRIIFK